MIKSRKMLPRVLSYKSRDFQIFTTAIDLVANSMKLDIDYFTNQVSMSKCKSAQVRSLASLVGYKYDEDLSPEQNRVIISNYRALIQLRGSLRGFELAVLVYGKIKGQEMRYSTPTLVDKGKSVLLSISNFDYQDIPMMKKILEIVRPVGLNVLIYNSNITNPKQSDIKIDEYSTSYNISQGSRSYKSIVRIDNFESGDDKSKSILINKEASSEVKNDQLGVVDHSVVSDDNGDSVV